MDRRKGIILLVQGAKRHLEGEDPEQQLFAGAVQVAAFLFHTIRQLRLAGQSIINILRNHSWHHRDLDRSDILQGALLLL